MAKSIQLEHDIPLSIRSLSRLEKQLPFAHALALTQTAKDVQKFTVEKHVPSKLTVRNRWSERGKFAFRITPARKGSAPFAEVYSRAPWLKLQEQGGIKRPANRKLIIAKEGSPARKTYLSKINKRVKPRPNDTRKGRRPFFHPKFKGVFRVFGRGKKKRLQLLWTVADKARVRAKLGFHDAGAKRAAKRYPMHFDDALHTTLRTAI